MVMATLEPWTESAAENVDVDLFLGVAGDALQHLLKDVDEVFLVVVVVDAPPSSREEELSKDQPKLIPFNESVNFRKMPPLDAAAAAGVGVAAAALITVFDDDAAAIADAAAGYDAVAFDNDEVVLLFGVEVK